MKFVVCAVLVTSSCAVTVRFYKNPAVVSCDSFTGLKFAHMYEQFCAPFAGSPYDAVSVDVCNQTWMNGTRWFMERSQSSEPPLCGYPARAEHFSLQLSTSACQPLFGGVAKVIDSNCSPAAAVFAIGSFPSSNHADQCSPTKLWSTHWWPIVASQTCNVGAYKGVSGAVAVLSNSTLSISIYMDFWGKEGTCPSRQLQRRWPSASVGNSSCTPHYNSDMPPGEYLRVLPMRAWERTSAPSPLLTSLPSPSRTSSTSPSPGEARATRNAASQPSTDLPTLQLLSAAALSAVVGASSGVVVGAMWAGCGGPALSHRGLPKSAYHRAIYGATLVVAVALGVLFGLIGAGCYVAGFLCIVGARDARNSYVQQRSSSRGGGMQHGPPLDVVREIYNPVVRVHGHPSSTG